MRAAIAICLFALLAAALAPAARAKGLFELIDARARIDDPVSVAAGPHGTMWFASDVGAYSPKGPRYSIGSADLAGHFHTYRTSAGTLGIAVTRDGTVFATERLANKVAVLRPGGKVAEVRVPTTGAHPSSIAVGPDGNGWFVEEPVDKVARITPGGRITEFALPEVPYLGATTGAAPFTILSGPGDRLWVTIANGIAAITTSGAITEYAFSFAFPATPATLAAAPDGTLWSAELDAPQLDHIAADGRATALPASQGMTGAPIVVSAGGAVSVFDASNTRWRVRPGRAPVAQRLQYRQSGGSVAQVRARFGVPGAALGPAGTIWLAADVQVGAGSTGGIAILNDGGRCIVPSLRFEFLKQVRRDLANHSCRLGRVRKHSRLPMRDLQAIRQTPRPGAVKRRGTRVAVTMG